MHLYAIFQSFFPMHTANLFFRQGENVNKVDLQWCTIGYLNNIPKKFQQMRKSVLICKRTLDICCYFIRSRNKNSQLISCWNLEPKLRSPDQKKISEGYKTLVSFVHITIPSSKVENWKNLFVEFMKSKVWKLELFMVVHLIKNLLFDDFYGAHKNVEKKIFLRQFSPC